MESNQITCPQCGLVNNDLAEACAQCGIIFVKNQPTKPAQASRDDQKRRAIEEAEAILNQTLPPSEMDAAGNETVKKDDLDEDTIEMQIPVETAAGAPEEPKLEEYQNIETHEIEMEAIEVPEEGSADKIDAETLFLSEITTTQTAAATAVETAETDADSSAETQKAVDSSDLTIKLEGTEQDDPEQKKANAAIQQSEAMPGAKTKLAQNSGKEKTAKIKLEGAEPVKAQSPAGQVIEPGDTRNGGVVGAGPTKKKIPFGEKPKPDMGRKEAVQSSTLMQPAARIEMPQQSPEAHARAKKEKPKEPEDAHERQKQLQVLEALKRQREKQAKVEESSKAREAQANAVAFRKPKLTQAKAEALKKQKMAQAKAEALKKQKADQAKALTLKKQRANQARLEVLKKQKEAQAKAEASAQEIEIASADILPDTSRNAAGNHERLLALLKKYKGKAIGINYDNSAEIKEAELVDANEEFFSIVVKDKKLQYSYPLKTILTIVEGQEGVETGDDDQKTKFDAVIKVYPLVLF